MTTDQFQIPFSEIEDARTRLAGIARTTPLLQSQIDPGLRFKAENLQFTGSFKLRTAYNQVALLPESRRTLGIVTSSSGNYAQGTALAATRAGVSAKIVMMRSSNPVKVQGTMDFGGEVVFCDNHFSARQEVVDRIAAEEHRTTIHPFDHPAAVAGNATVGMEIVDQFPEVKNVVTPVSGGGLISGIAAALRHLRPAVRIWGVQPEGSNATVLSFKKGRRIEIEKARTIADGVMVTFPGQLTFGLIQESVHDIVQVSEEAILEAVRELMLVEKLVVEPAGALPLAAARSGLVPRDETVLVLTGGNMDPRIYRRLFCADALDPGGPDS